MKHRGKWVRAIAAIAGALLGPLSLGAKAAPPPPGSPAAINGKVYVCGTKLCNQYDNPIQLRGMSTHGTQWFSQCITDQSLDVLANDWKADIIRVSTYVQESGYERNPTKYTNLVHRIIGQATARGLYVIVDWHMLDPGDPYFNLERARTFFAEIASRHKNKTNIFYEVANEPNGTVAVEGDPDFGEDITWERIKNYHEEIIPVIREIDTDAVILLGTLGWSSLGASAGSNEREVINNPVDATNIMYTFHFYAASHDDYHLATLSRAANRIPMFVTEFGTQDYAGEGINNFVQSQRYLNLMKTKKISWVNWNYSDDERSGAVFKEGTCYSETGIRAGTSQLKEAGVWIRARVRTGDDFPTY